MTEVNLQKLLKKNKEDNKSMFLIDGNLFWTNHIVLVRDDPNLKKCLEDFFLRKIEPDEAYNLDVEEYRIKIIGEEKISSFRIYKNFLKENIQEYKKLHASETKRLSESRIPCYGFRVEDGEDFIFVDKDYVDYLRDMNHYDEIFLRNKIKNLDLVYFLKNKKITAILAPLYVPLEKEMKCSL